MRNILIPRRVGGCARLRTSNVDLAGGKMITTSLAPLLAFQRPAVLPRPFAPSPLLRVAARVSMVAPMLPAGPLVALVTPMTESGAVDIPALRELLQGEGGGDGRRGDPGDDGRGVGAYAEERGEVMAAAREEVGADVDHRRHGHHQHGDDRRDEAGEAFGADAALIVTPYYVKPTQGGLLNHFTQIADAAELPIVLYNVPGRTGVDMSIETTVALAPPDDPGPGDATGDNGRAAPLRAVCGDDFRLYRARGMARDYVLQGGDGAISVTANVAPAGVAKVMAAANARDRSAAEAADAPLQALHRDLFCEANPIPVKWALAKMGRMQGGIRSPLAPLGIDFHGRVEAALSNAKLIAGAAGASSSFGWPSRQLLLQGHLFDQGLINQALEIIEKRGGDFEIVSFSATPNDQRTEFNFRRTSSITLKIFGVDGAALDDITARLQSLVDVLESAEGVLTTIPEPAA